MGYGPTKYAAPQLARNITEVIGDHMARFSAFNNTSLAYFGARIKYRIEIELFARGETKEVVQKELTIGANPTLEEQTDPTLGITAETVVVEGEKSAGRIPKSPEEMAAEKAKQERGKTAPSGTSKSQSGGRHPRNELLTQEDSIGAGKAGKHSPSDAA